MYTYNLILHKNYNFYNMRHDCVYNISKKFVIIIIIIILNHIKIKNAKIQKKYNTPLPNTVEN